MAKNQSPQRSDQEWFNIITECRQSGLSDSKWCSINGISKSTFSIAAKRLRNKSYAIPAKAEVNIDPLDFTSKQEVVKIDIVQELNPAKYMKEAECTLMQPILPAHLDNSHTIEIQLENTIIRLSNNANPDLVKIVTESLVGGRGYAG